MKITRGHADLWTLKKAPDCIRAALEPKETKIKGYFAPAPFDINSLIPMEPIPSERKNRYYEVNNTLHLLAMMRRQGKDIYQSLRELAASPHSSKDRRVLCSRWWRKIHRNRLKNRKIKVDVLIFCLTM